MTATDTHQLRDRSGRVSDNHIPELDGLRGVAVIMVLCWHFIGNMLRPGMWAGSGEIQSALIFGRTGVDLFFVLSGFLIVGILIDQRGAPNLFRTFYARRIMRIQPPYLVLIAFYWLAYLATGPNDAFNTTPNLAIQLVAQLTFTWNWLMAYYNGAVATGLSVVWSVAIEEWFYLIFPVIIVAVPPKRLPAVLASIGLASIVARVAFYLARPDMHLTPYILPPFRLDGLCAGGLLAYAYRNKAALNWLKQHRRRLRTTAIILAISIPAVIAAIKSDLYRQMHLWGHTYLSIAYSIILIAVVTASGIKQLGWLRGRFLTAAGRYSYSLYLFHPFFIALYFFLAGRARRLNTWEDAGIGALALITSIVFCGRLYRYLEAPALRLGKQASYKNAAPTHHNSVAQYSQ